MAAYEVKSTDIKHFVLTKDEKDIGQLNYMKWFSFNAEMIFPDKTVFQVLPKGFWGTTIELKKDDTVLLNFKMHWNGNIVIKTKFNNKEEDFIFKHKSIFKSAYILLNKNEEEIAVIQPDYKWKKFSYDYKIITTDSFDEISFNNILLLTTVHCANYYMNMISTGAMAGSV